MGKVQGMPDANVLKDKDQWEAMTTLGPRGETVLLEPIEDTVIICNHRATRCYSQRLKQEENEE